MSRLNEFEAIALLRKYLHAPSDAVELSIGDDAAILKGSPALVWSIDDSVQGVHFELEWLSLRQIARRAIHAAASDLAAMGAAPLGALCSLQLPPTLMERSRLRAIAGGQRQASLELGLPIIGGNITGGQCLRFSTTVLGHAARPLLRSGARSGDEVWLLGKPGLADIGLRIVQGDLVAPAGVARAAARCVRAWRSPNALLGQAQQLGEAVHSAIDISDGLVADAAHLAEASNCALILDEALLSGSLASELLRCAKWLSLEPMRVALFGGEDYSLLLTGSAEGRPDGARLIGHIEHVRKPGVFLAKPSGIHLRLAAKGFDHLSGAAISQDG